MAAIPRLDEANLQAICEILGHTSTGLTGSQCREQARRVYYGAVLEARKEIPVYPCPSLRPTERKLKN